MVSSANIEYFNPQQRAEIFRIKGLFKEHVSSKQHANDAFSHAMQICGSYGKGWLTWAKYCDVIFAEQVTVHCAAQSMACYLQAVQHKSNTARLMLGRVLWLLTSDDEKLTLGR